MPSPMVRQAFLTPREDNQADTTWLESIQNDGLANNALLTFTQANSSDRVSSETCKDANGSTVTTNFAEIAQFAAGQSGAAWLATGCTAGIRQINAVITPSDQFVQRLVLEIAGLSTAAPASAVRTTVVPGSQAITGNVITAGTLAGLTPGDWLIQIAFEEGGNPIPAGDIIPGSGWEPLTLNDTQGFYVQTKIAQSASEVASFTRPGSTGTWDTVAIAIKADATKGDATQATLGNTFVRSVLGLYIAPNLGPIVPFHFPSKGNCLAGIFWQGTGTIKVVGVLDNQGNSWGTARAKASQTNGQIEAWSPGASKTSPYLSGSVTFGDPIGSSAGGMLVFFDVMGTKSNNPIGALSTVNNKGTQSVAGNVVTESITPTGVGSAILGGIIVNSHAVSGIAGGTKWLAAMGMYANADGAEQQMWDCDGTMVYYNGSDLSAQTPSYTTQHNTAGVGTWAAVAMEILAETTLAAAQGQGNTLQMPWRLG